MEFLVNIEINWPPETEASRREEIFAAELARGQELAREGKMLRIWRVPGRWANWSLYEVTDATELHAALASLPLYPWMDIRVHPLAKHVNDPPVLGLGPDAAEAPGKSTTSGTSNTPAERAS